MTITAEMFRSSIPTAMILDATQELVDVLLSLNVRNRRPRPHHIEYFTREAAGGRLTLTPQGIGVDNEGVMIDGQHRLRGIAAAGYPPGIKLLVVFGLPPESRAAIDLGLNRSMVDLMHFAFQQPEATSAMMAISRFWGRRILGFGKKKPSPAEVFEWYQELLPQMVRVLVLPGASKQPAPVLAAISHRLHHFPSDERPLSFLERVISGAGLEPDSPALRLRDWLQGVHGARGGSEVQDERYERTMSALTAYLEGRTLKKLYARQHAVHLAEKKNVGADDSLTIQ